MTEDVPSKIGRYIIDRLAGAGAMGYVYVGKDPDLGRSVAIKTLRDLNTDSATFLERFKNEARAAAQLQHPSIVQVYDVGEDPAVGPYLVFEYVAGHTLKEVLRRDGALTPRRVVDIAEQIADALETAHAAGIVHRDVKPDNLLTTEDGRVKLADFGIARIPDAALTREGQFLGTPCYAAPETLMEAQYGPRSDLFSFAAVLYELATGTRAFPGDDAVAVANKVVHEEPSPPSDVATGPEIPRGVGDVLMRGLAKSADARYDGARTFALALRSAYEDAGVEIPQRESTGAIAIAPAHDGRGPRLDLGSDIRTGSQAGESRSSLPYLAVLAGGLAIGIALVVAWSRGPDVGDADAGPLDGSVDSGEDTVPARPTARDSAVVTLGAEPDAGTGVDTGAGPDTDLLQLSAHEREERAKDLIDEASDHLDAERWDEARRVLSEARRLDPGNGDITELEARLP